VAALFAIIRRLFTLELIEKRKLRACDMLYLLPKGAGIVELAACRNPTLSAIDLGISSFCAACFEVSFCAALSSATAERAATQIMKNAAKRVSLIPSSWISQAYASKGSNGLGQ